MGLQDVWGPLVAWDFFLAGAGAGAYLIGVLAGWWGGKARTLAPVGIYSGPVLVGLGALLLLVDLGQPAQFWRAFARPTGSVMSAGVVLVTLFILLGLVHMVLAWRDRGKGLPLGWLAGVNGVVALGVISYPGLLLGMLKPVPFWNSPMVVVLFLLSALLTGLAVVMLGGLLQRWLPYRLGADDEVKAAVAATIPWVAGLVVAELLGLFYALFVTSGSGVTAAESARFVVSGGYALPFWLGLVAVGLVAPLVLGLLAVRREGGAFSLGTAAAICLLVGGVMLRYTVLAAGANLPILIP